MRNFDLLFAFVLNFYIWSFWNFFRTRLTFLDLCCWRFLHKFCPPPYLGMIDLDKSGNDGAGEEIWRNSQTIASPTLTPSSLSLTITKPNPDIYHFQPCYKPWAKIPTYLKPWPRVRMSILALKRKQKKRRKEIKRVRENKKR